MFQEGGMRNSFFTYGVYIVSWGPSRVQMYMFILGIHCVYIYIYICIHIYMYAYVYCIIYTYICTHIYIYVYTHRYMICDICIIYIYTHWIYLCYYVFCFYVHMLWKDISPFLRVNEPSWPVFSPDHLIDRTCAGRSHAAPSRQSQRPLNQP